MGRGNGKTRGERGNGMGRARDRKGEKERGRDLPDQCQTAS